jgi:hypothetical protein
MKFHIVRTGESLEDILFLYNLTKDELVEDNRHIRVWEKLIPGTKLKIPSITESIEYEVNDMEPFIEDYYPKLTSDVEKSKDIEINDVSEEIEIEIPNSEGFIPVVKSNQVSDSDNSSEQIKTIDVSSVKDEIESNEKVVKTAKAYQPYGLGYYNYPRMQAYPYIYYPVYYKKRSR